MKKKNLRALLHVVEGPNRVEEHEEKMESHLDGLRLSGYKVKFLNNTAYYDPETKQPMLIGSITYQGQQPEGED